MNRDAAFTLVEIMVVMAVFSMIVGIGLVYGLRALERTTTRDEADEMVSVLQRARSRAMANIQQSPWGVHYSGVSRSYTIFRGSSYAANGSDSEIVPGNSNASISGASDVVFTQLSGTTTGSFAALISQNNSSSSISINYEGAIIW